MTAPPPPDLTGLSLKDIVGLADAQRLPPVELWKPERRGDSGMRIARDGSWHHDGALIRRPELVRLFASILRREADGRYVLVTPVERLDILVEDAPFVALEVASQDKGRNRRLAFRLNTGELVVAGPAHGLRIDEDGGGPRPYLRVRSGLEALIARAVYYELAELALAEGGDPPGLWSDGSFLSLVPSAPRSLA